MRNKEWINKVPGILGTAATVLFVLFWLSEGTGLTDLIARIYEIEGVFGLLFRFVIFSIFAASIIMLLLTIGKWFVNNFVTIVVIVAIAFSIVVWLIHLDSKRRIEHLRNENKALYEEYIEKENNEY